MRKEISKLEKKLTPPPALTAVHVFIQTDEDTNIYEMEGVTFTREEAENTWGDLVGQGQGHLQIGYYTGCSSCLNRYRATNCSLMRPGYCPFGSPETVSENRLGLSNIRLVQHELNRYTNTPII